MRTRPLAAALAACLLLTAPAARADNPMGYRLLSQQEAAQLPRNGGGLGLDVERSDRITDRGLTFDIIRIKDVRRGSTGAAAGLARGDQIIAVDGRVFASLTAFAAYVGAVPPGRPVEVDYIPAGGGPQQAQRVAVEVGQGGRPGQGPIAESGGMSTGKKLAIGAGAAALLGCYALGCFSHKSNNATVPVR